MSWVSELQLIFNIASFLYVMSMYVMVLLNQENAHADSVGVLFVAFFFSFFSFLFVFCFLFFLPIAHCYVQAYSFLVIPFLLCFILFCPFPSTLVVGGPAWYIT